MPLGAVGLANAMGPGSRSIDRESTRIDPTNPLGPRGVADAAGTIVGCRTVTGGTSSPVRTCERTPSGAAATGRVVGGGGVGDAEGFNSMSGGEG